VALMWVGLGAELGRHGAEVVVATSVASPWPAHRLG